MKFLLVHFFVNIFDCWTVRPPEKTNGHFGLCIEWTVHYVEAYNPDLLAEQGSWQYCRLLWTLWWCIVFGDKYANMASCLVVFSLLSFVQILMIEDAYVCNIHSVLAAGQWGVKTRIIYWLAKSYIIHIFRAESLNIFLCFERACVWRLPLGSTVHQQYVTKCDRHNGSSPPPSRETAIEIMSYSWHQDWSHIETSSGYPDDEDSVTGNRRLPLHNDSKPWRFQVHRDEHFAAK